MHLKIKTTFTDKMTCVHIKLQSFPRQVRAKGATDRVYSRQPDQID